MGIVPAILVVWIRRSVPEPAEWHAAKATAGQQPGIGSLFNLENRRTTTLTILVCACSLTAWWAFMFWSPQHIRNLPDLASRPKVERERLAYMSFLLVIGVSILGNFFASWVARHIGYRRAIALMCAGFFFAMFGTYSVPRGHVSLFLWMPWVGFFSGVFGLFTMYLPPLFPTLLRTTGAGFSYNIGRVVAAFGTIFFGFFAHVGDFRHALMYDSFLFIPAVAVALMLPEGDAVLPRERELVTEASR